MLAALSIVDHGLVERLMQETFPRVSPSADTSNVDGVLEDRESRKSQIAEEKARAVGAQVRDKVMKSIEACREMLAKEPPERRTYWHEVKKPQPPSPSCQASPLVFPILN